MRTPSTILDQKMGTVTRILVVDDCPVYRRSLLEFLDGMAGIEICGEAADGDAAVAKEKELEPA